MVKGLSAQGFCALSAAVGAVALAACSAVLGIDDRAADPTLGTGLDGSVADGGVTPDAPTPPSDAPPEARADVGPCGDTQTDPNNCGVCGHGCLGGACAAGMCQPITLAPGRAYLLAADATSIYWTTLVGAANEVNKTDKVTGNTVTLSQGGATSPLWAPYGIAVDSANVYFTTTAGYVFRCAIGGCANAPTQLAATAGTPRFIAVDATNVYWTEDSTTAAIRKVDKADGGGLKTYAEGPNPAFIPEALAADGQSIYFTNDDGIVRKFPVAGGAATILATAAGPSYALTLDPTHVYWSSANDPGPVSSVPKAGGASLVLVAQAHQPEGVAVDGNNIYWTNLGNFMDDGTIMMCPFANCPAPVKLASGQATPKGIAVDANAVYWSNYDISKNGKGGIMKVAKP